MKLVDHKKAPRVQPVIRIGWGFAEPQHPAVARSTGEEAYWLVEELSMLLGRHGISNPGQEEQNAYILQNLLTAGESTRWISLANADEKFSDAALNVLELGTANARMGRLSCPTPHAGGVFRRPPRAPSELPHRATAGDHRRQQRGFLLRPGRSVRRQP
jgi:hypothetical protein